MAVDNFWKEIRSLRGEITHLNNEKVYYQTRISELEGELEVEQNSRGFIAFVRRVLPFNRKEVEKEVATLQPFQSVH